MTPIRAKAVLNRPLVFGDPEQIQAMKVIVQVDLAVEVILKYEHDYNPTAKRKQACSCISSFPFEILRAAVADPRMQVENGYHRKWIERNCN